LNIIGQIRAAPADRPVVAMLRHAQREPILDRESGWHAPLTAAGLRDAEALGRTLAPFGGIRLDHSPIPRCIQTVDAMVLGLREFDIEAQVGGAIEHFAGPFIRELDPVINHYVGRGNPAFLRSWFDGEFPAEHLQPAREAALEQVAALNPLLDVDAPRLRAVVSHDWNIALVRECILGVAHEDVGMPACLDGVVAWRDDERLVLRFGDVVATLHAGTLPAIG